MLENQTLMKLKTTLKKNKDVYMNIRYTAIFSYLQGYTYKKIVSFLILSPQTISSYVEKYKAKALLAKYK